MTPRRPLATLAAAATALGLPALAGGQESAPSLGGGSDVGGGAVVSLRQGQRIGPAHYVFADNPESARVHVGFRAEAPPGIIVTPEWRTRSIPPGGKVENRFSLGVSEIVAPGSYPLLVSLVRTDVVSRPGRVTNVPAIGTRFVVRVTGAAGTIRAKAVDASGEPVEGTLVLATQLGDGRTFEVTREAGSQLERRVAPGRYVASFLSGDREQARKTVTVATDEVTPVALKVEAVSFAVAEVRPVEEDGEVVVAELVAAVANELELLPGPVTLRARIRRDGREVDDVELERLERLPPGITESRLTYRPEAGWEPGTYRVVYELATPELTLRRQASTPIEIGEAPARLMPLSVGAIVAALAGLLLLLLARRLRRTHD